MSDSYFMTATQVCRRYGGISDMTLWRWSNDPDLGFPKPVYINRRRFWPVEALDAFDEKRQAA